MRLAQRVSSLFEANRLSKIFGDTEQFDRHPSRRRRMRITSQPLCPRKPRVCTLGTGEGCRRDSEQSRGERLDLDLDALVAHQLDACTSVGATTPVIPSNGLRSDNQWMQQHAHLARLCSGAALPLALLAQWTGTATADAGSIHHAQAPIGFSALFMWDQLLVSGATQRPIRLERKVLAREAASFPG